MAEEILYDEQVVTDDQGDPKDPLGLRKKLSATKTKDDPLGLRAKLKPVQPTLVTHEQALALPKIDYSKPVFQENVSESTAVPQVNNQALLATPPRETVADKFENKVKQSRDKVFTELTTNDKAIENLIRKQKFEEAGRAVELPNSDMSVNGALANDVARMVKPETRPQDMPVTPEEMQQKKALVANDDSQARRLLEEVVRVDPSKKSEVQKSIYDLDIANALQNDPEGQANVRKVMDNSKKIENGDLIYDFKNGNLIKPLNPVQSALQGWKAGSQVRDEFSIFNKMNDAQLSTMLDAQMATNQGKSKYDPVEVPEGLVGNMLQGLAMSPATTVGGAAGSLAGPEGGIIAGSVLGAGETAQRDYVVNLKRVYQELRAKGVDQLEAIKEAKSQALHAAGVGAVEGAAFGFIGARFGVRALPKAALTSGFRNAVVSTLKGAGQTVGTAVKEGLAAGGITAAGEIYKNHLAKEAGIDRDIDEGVADAIESNLLFTLGMAGAVKAMKVGGKIYKNLLSGLSKADDAKISGSLNEMIQNKAITEEQATKLQEDLTAFKKEDSTIPENIAPEARLQISEKIKKRNELEQKMESTDKAFHPEIKEKIKAIEEEITSLSKDTVKPEKTDTEVQGIIDDAVDEGRLAGVMGNVAKSDPQGFMKFVADQALGRTETGEMSSLPDAEYAVRDQYGDAIVDKALEMFPLEKPKESSISVIRPEERTQPTETVTIAPKEEKVPIETPIQEDPIVPETVPPMDIPEMTGITHAKMNELAQKLGLPDYQGDPETVAGWNFEAAKRIRENPQAIPELLTKMRNGEMPSAVEQRMMAMYVADLQAKIEKNPGSDELLAALKRAKDLSNIVGGRDVAKSLRARQELLPVEETVGDYLNRQQEVSRVEKLTEQQKETNIKEHKDITEAEAALDEKVAKLEIETAAKEAEKKVKEIKATTPTTKKAHTEYVKDRKDIIQSMQDKLKKARGETSVVAVPYAKELIAIAPDVAKLVKSLVEEGIDKLPGLVDAVHKQLKEFIEPITKDDVRALIAGDYNEKKQTRSQLAIKLRDLKDEAKLIGKLEDLEAGIEPKSEAGKKKRNQEIEALKQKIKEHDLTKLAATKTRLKSEIAKIEKQLADGDFEKEKKEPVKLDKEANELKDKLNRLRIEREIRLYKEEYANRPKIQKIGDAIGNVLNVPRSIMSSMDFSAPFRQGLVATVANPGIAKNAMAKMFKFAFSQTQYDRWFTELKESPHYNTMIESGLALSDPHDPLLSAKEEAFMSNLAGKIPGVGRLIKGSERAYTGYLNKLRADFFTKLTDAYEADGKTIQNSPELYKQTADYVNATTGRGTLGKTLEKAAPVLNSIFFSPRLIASRLKLLTGNGMLYKKVPKEVRVQYIKDMAKFIGAGTAMLALANLSGAEVEDDPRSSDFGKIKSGNTRWDIWGGFQQYVRLFSQMLSGQKVSNGQVAELDAKGPFGESRGTVLGRFGRGKLAPVPALAIDLLSGRTLMGDKVKYNFDLNHGDKEVTLTDLSMRSLMPLIISDVKDAVKDQGVKALFTVGIPSSLGVGVQTQLGSTGTVKKKGSNKPKRTGRQKPKKS